MVTEIRPPHKEIFSSQTIFLAVVVLAVGGVLLYLLQDIQRSVGARSGAWTARHEREFANQLKTSGLIDQAIDAYENYLSQSQPDLSERSKIYFNLGETLYQAHRYEEALAYYYKAEIADTQSVLKNEINQGIVNSLERSGRKLDANYEMDTRSLMGSTGEAAAQAGKSEAVARIGDREITMAELDEALNKLPKPLKDRYSNNDEERLDFLRQYIAHELLYEKGIQRGLDKEPQVREKIDDFSKEIIVQSVVQETVQKEASVNPMDVRNFYEAHKDRYESKPFEEVADKVQSDYRRYKEMTLVSELIGKLVESKEVWINKDRFGDLLKKSPDAKAAVEPGSGEAKKER